MKKLFTSESVTEGHPDKVCDQISDAILDAILAQDTGGRVAAETTVNTGYAMIMGEISTNCYIDISKIAREVICDIGYIKSEYGYDGNTCAIMTSIDEQSGDIAMGVDDALEHKEGKLAEADLAIGAGDQGI
ncbi:MAG: S-adenosylmethionine synthetase N-terminal domain-containing protein, partial [Anaerovoracaceae bacterium]